MANQYAVSGKSSEASIDQVNIWMRSTPWYQQQVKAWGQDPGHPKLQKWQRAQLLAQAQAQGVGVTNDVEIDEGGNLDKKGHALRNTLIVAGIAGATIATMGAAGVFSGAVTAPGIGGATLTSTGVPALSSASTLAGATGAGTTAAGVAGGAAGAGAAFDAAGNFIGPSTYSGENTIRQVSDTATRGVSSWLTDAIKVGIPTAGGLIGAGMANAANTEAAKIQDAYLREALAYEKERDAADRKRQAEQDARLAALDTYNQGQDQLDRDWKTNQYADLTGRLEPYLAAGTSSSDRMASLLGLPARPPSTPVPPAPRASGSSSGSSSGGAGYDAGDVSQQASRFYDAVAKAGLDPVAVQGHGQTIVDAINAAHPDVGAYVDPKTDAVVWPGVGALDVTIDSGKGGWSFRPTGPAPPRPTSTTTTTPPRTTAPTATVTAPAPPLAGPTSAPPPGPAAPEPLITIQAPNGQRKQVPASERDHWESVGATVIGVAA